MCGNRCARQMLKNAMCKHEFIRLCIELVQAVTARSYSVMVSTRDFESRNPGSTPGRTFSLFFENTLFFGKEACQFLRKIFCAGDHVSHSLATAP